MKGVNVATDSLVNYADLIVSGELRMKTAIFLYDRSGIMAQPWLEKGYQCVLIDGQHETGISVDPRQPLLHRWGMWIDALTDQDAIIEEISSHYPAVERYIHGQLGF